MSIVWNPSKIDQATFCIMQFYLINEEKVKIPMTGPMAEGILLHQMMEDFYAKKSGIIRPKYKSAESFANAAGARWSYFIKKGKIRGSQIEWKDKEEPWVIKADIKKICKKVYGRLLMEEPPLYREVSFDFELDQRRFNGRMDAIRAGPTGPIIRDYKTGQREPGTMKLSYDPQFTLYCLALGCMCHKDQKFALSLGVSKEEAARWAGNPLYLSPKIKMEYYSMREDKIFTMERNDVHYHDFCRMIDGLEKQIESGNIYPERGRNCDYCSVKRACDARTAGAIAPVKKDVQLNIFRGIPYLSETKKFDGKQLKLFKRKRKVKEKA